MAGDKMSKEKKPMNGCDRCGMGKMCGSLSGVIVLIAGLSFLAFAFGKLDGMTAHMVGGAALLLYGLGVLVHSLGACNMCK